MLIIMRRMDEEIVIDGNIRIVVVRIQGGQVHLGIDAPKEIPVYRAELLENAEEGDGKDNAKFTRSDDKDGNC